MLVFGVCVALLLLGLFVFPVEGDSGDKQVCTTAPCEPFFREDADGEQILSGWIQEGNCCRFYCCEDDDYTFEFDEDRRIPEHRRLKASGRAVAVRGSGSGANLALRASVATQSHSTAKTLSGGRSAAQVMFLRRRATLYHSVAAPVRNLTGQPGEHQQSSAVCAAFSDADTCYGAGCQWWPTSVVATLGTTNKRVTPDSCHPCADDPHTAALSPILQAVNCHEPSESACACATAMGGCTHPIVGRFMVIGCPQSCIAAFQGHSSLALASEFKMCGKKYVSTTAVSLPSFTPGSGSPSVSSTAAGDDDLLTTEDPTFVGDEISVADKCRIFEPDFMEEVDEDYPNKKITQTKCMCRGGGGGDHEVCGSMKILPEASGAASDQEQLNDIWFLLIYFGVVLFAGLSSLLPLLVRTCHGFHIGYLNIKIPSILDREWNGKEAAQDGAARLKIFFHHQTTPQGTGCLVMEEDLHTWPFHISIQLPMNDASSTQMSVPGTGDVQGGGGHVASASSGGQQSPQRPVLNAPAQETIGQPTVESQSGGRGASTSNRTDGNARAAPANLVATRTPNKKKGVLVNRTRISPAPEDNYREPEDNSVATTNHHHRTHQHRAHDHHPPPPPPPPPPSTMGRPRGKAGRF